MSSASDYTCTLDSHHEAGPRVNVREFDCSLGIIRDACMGTEPFPENERCITDKCAIRPETRIRHAHLQVSDLTRTFGFYYRVLGFE